MNRRSFLQTAALAPSLSLPSGLSQAQPQHASPEAGPIVTIHTGSTAGALPHFWEECVGSDRAVVGLREQWLSDLSTVRKATGIKSVRFHGLFNDEMGVCPSNVKQLNFLYIDSVFDAMLERGVKPFVELSFMPAGLASGKSTAFWYRGNTSPPKELAEWRELVRALAQHCVDRYGAAEVRSWKFEVWNEPNLRYFWAGTKEQYFELYRQSAEAVKSVDPALAVGGPSTAQAGWAGDLLDYCAARQVPIDFVSTHIYPDDPQKNVFGDDRAYSYEEVIPKALTMVRQQIKASKYPNLPLYITEWASQNPAFIAHTIKSCAGLAEVMSYWTFDNVFEELGVPRGFFNGAFGLLGTRGVPRPSFNTFVLLHKLGTELLACDDAPLLPTRRDDGSLAILAWNLIPRKKGQRTSMGDPLSQTEDKYSSDGAPITLNLKLQGASKRRRALLTRVDDDHGSATAAYRGMGSPAYPTTKQIADLKRAAELPRAEALSIGPHGEFRLTLPANGVALIEIA